MPQPKDIDWLNGYKNKTQGFPGGAVVENLPANAGDTGLINEVEHFGVP